MGNAATTAKDVYLARDVAATTTAVARDLQAALTIKNRRWYAKWMQWIRGVDDEE